MKSFFIPVFTLFAFAAQAQSLTPKVVASAGTFASNGTYSLSYTVGEVAVTTLSASGHHLTQGFQQPDEKAVSVTALEFTDLQIKLYPNPASETVNLWIKCDNNACNNLRVSIHDLLGREITVTPEASRSGNEMLYQFDIKNLAASMYFVRLRDEARSFSQVIRFNKTSL